MHKRALLGGLYGAYGLALGLTGSAEGLLAGLVVVAVGVVLARSGLPVPRPVR